MLAKTGSVALVGVDARLVEVEVDVNTGVPKFTIVGLPAKSVREAEQRTRSALLASSERWPPARVVANLAPAGLRKDGTHFDLPIALGLIAGDRRMDPGPLEDWVVIGELGLDGSVRRVRGALAAALACRASNKRGLICPAGNAAEAAVVEGIEIVPVSTLKECAGFLRGKWVPGPVPTGEPLVTLSLTDLQEVRGQDDAKRALEIAAAGGHNLLLSGPPGSGKTMLAQRLPGILPSMSQAESLDVTRVHSVAGVLPEGASLIAERPFRAPHHHISMAGLIGGGSGIGIPGEISLAHHGVLFLDEIPLYRRDALESLRSPLDEGVVRISRAGGSVWYPCRFALIAAMNPCPCGYRGDTARPCTCSDSQLRAYSSRLSGPLLDRFDLQVRVDRVTQKELLAGPEGESSESVRDRVEAARNIQTARFGSDLRTNATSTRRELDQFVTLNSNSRSMLADAIDQLSLTGRGFTRVLRIARTIADLEGQDLVDELHVAEALGLRFLYESGVAA